eukprot:TRINITY_DN879_c6_g1_i1.p1 TRINITY_DN879_c6_g1~~TRINITY_DN879_c6_g1_i1.p1  ORF type:complete len:151 (+),score=8.95 TRINITY_DN879_c6_g1_i1:105-557(+)
MGCCAAKDDRKERNQQATGAKPVRKPSGALVKSPEKEGEGDATSSPKRASSPPSSPQSMANGRRASTSSPHPKPNITKFIPTGAVGNEVVAPSSPSKTCAATQEQQPEPVRDQYSNCTDDRKPMTEHEYQKQMGAPSEEEIPKLVVEICE